MNHNRAVGHVELMFSTRYAALSGHAPGATRFVHFLALASLGASAGASSTLPIVRNAFAEIIAPLLGCPCAAGSGIADLLWGIGLGQSCVACSRYFYRDGRSRYWRANSQNKCQSHRRLQISGDHLARSFKPSENRTGPYQNRQKSQTAKRRPHCPVAKLFSERLCFRIEISIVSGPAAFCQTAGCRHTFDPN
ncbi:hypothetical protein ACVWXM_001461 [Bradyrhizobium sp. GM7.3]